MDANQTLADNKQENVQTTEDTSSQPSLEILQFEYQFIVLKNYKWKGSRMCVMGISPDYVAILDPEDLNTTFLWYWKDVNSIELEPSSSSDFYLVLSADAAHPNNKDTVPFSSDSRARIMCLCRSYINQAKVIQVSSQINCQKMNPSFEKEDIRVVLSEGFMYEYKGAIDMLVNKFEYIDVKEYHLLVEENGFILKVHSQNHIYLLDNFHQFINILSEFMSHVGLAVSEKTPLSIEAIHKDYSLTINEPVVQSFEVTKFSSLNSTSQELQFSISETRIYESDASSSFVYNTFSIANIAAAVRDAASSRFILYFNDQTCCIYETKDRDLVLCLLSDAFISLTRRHLVVYTDKIDFGNVVLFSLDTTKSFIESIASSNLFSVIEQYIDEGNPNFFLTHESFIWLLQLYYWNVSISGPIKTLNEKTNANINATFIELIEACQIKDENKEILDSTRIFLWKCLSILLNRTTIRSTYIYYESSLDIILFGMKSQSDEELYWILQCIKDMILWSKQNRSIKDEQEYRTLLFSDDDFLSLFFDIFDKSVADSSRQFILYSILEILNVLLYSYPQTTEEHVRFCILEKLSTRYNSLLSLFYNKCYSIVLTTAFLLKALIEDSSSEISERMHLNALKEGIFLEQFYNALFSKNEEERNVSRYLVELWARNYSQTYDLLQRILPFGIFHYLDEEPLTEHQLQEFKEQEVLFYNRYFGEEAVSNSSRHNPLNYEMNTASLPMEGFTNSNSPSFDHLRDGDSNIKAYTDTDLVQEYSTHLDGNEVKKSEEKIEAGPIVLSQADILQKGITSVSQASISPVSRAIERESALPIVSEAPNTISAVPNYTLFFYQLLADHSTYSLIWNDATRKELQDRLECELDIIHNPQQPSMLRWNFEEFFVEYKSLEPYLCVENYYICNYNALHEKNGKLPVENPKKLFNSLFIRLLLHQELDQVIELSRCLCYLYQDYASEIGTCPFINRIISFLMTTTSLSYRNSLIQLVCALLLHKENVSVLIHNSSQLISLLSNILLSSFLVHNESLLAESEKSCANQSFIFYTDSNDQRQGPLSLKKFVDLYANGTVQDSTLITVEGETTPLSSCPLLKWYAIESASKEPSTLGFTELSISIVTIFQSMNSFYSSYDNDLHLLKTPIPRVKQALNRERIYMTLFALFLIQDSSLNTVLCSFLLDFLDGNLSLLSSLHATGLMYFMMLYKGPYTLPYLQLLLFVDQAISSNESVKATSCQPFREGQVSYLLNYLPCHFVDLLYMNTDASLSQFAAEITGSQSSISLIWNPSLLGRLQAHMYSFMQSYYASLFVNPYTHYQYVHVPALDYSVFVDDLFVHHYYIHQLCSVYEQDQSCVRDDKELIEDMNAFLRSYLQNTLPRSEYYQQYIAQHHLPAAVLEDRAALDQWYVDECLKPESSVKELEAVYNFILSYPKESGEVVYNYDTITTILNMLILMYKYNQSSYSAFIYQGFDVLNRATLLSLEECFDPEKSTSLLSVVLELVLFIIGCSEDNSAAYIQQGSLSTIISIFGVYKSMKKEELTGLQISVLEKLFKLVYLLSSFESNLSAFEGKTSIIPFINGFLTYQSVSSSIIINILNFYNNVSRSPALTREVIYSSGVSALWLLLLLLLKTEYTYDSQLLTPEDASVSTPDSSVPSAEAQLNNASLLSSQLNHKIVQTLSMLCGFANPEKNENLIEMLSHVFIPSLMTLLEAQEYDAFLNELATYSGSVYKIWTADMKKEIIDFITEHMKDDISVLQSFTYSRLATELYIDTVYVSIYNKEQPETIHNEEQFIDQLFGKLDSWNLNASAPALMYSCSESTADEVEQLLIALNTFTKNSHSSFDKILKESYLTTLYSFLLPQTEQNEYAQSSSLRQFALNVLLDISDLPSYHALLVASPRFLTLFIDLLMNDVYETYVPIISILTTLFSLSPAILQFFIEHKGLLCLLYTLCEKESVISYFYKDMTLTCMFNILHINSSTHVVYTTQLLSKCMPSELVTAFYESKDKFAAMFDATVETPLYLWNEKMKTELKTVLKERYREFLESTELKEDLHLVDYNVVNQEFKLRDLYVRYFYNSKEFVYSNNEVLLDSLFKWIDLEFDYLSLADSDAEIDRNMDRENELQLFVPSSYLHASVVCVPVACLFKILDRERKSGLYNKFIERGGYLSKLIAQFKASVYDNKSYIYLPIAHILKYFISYSSSFESLILSDKSNNYILSLLTTLLTNNSYTNTVEIFRVLYSFFSSSSSLLGKQMLSSNLVPTLFACIETSDSSDPSDEKYACGVSLIKLIYSKLGNRTLTKLYDQHPIWQQLKQQTVVLPAPSQEASSFDKEANSILNAL